MRRLVGLGLLTVALTACSGSRAPSTDSTPGSAEGVQCFEPPQSELEAASSLTMTVEPNPVEAGAIATLSVSTDEPPYVYMVGAGATWQCWDGTAWVATYQILRDGYGSGEADPVTLEVIPGATTTIPAIGLNVPNSYPIRIPTVPPGTYRIIDQVEGRGERVGGHVIVVVR